MSRRMKKASERTALLDHLDEGGPAGVDEGGQPWVVRGAPLGATVRLRTGRKNKGQLLAVVEPAADAVAPVCPVFGLCGGCQLQASPLSRQRLAKAELLGKLVGAGPEVAQHGVGGGASGYHYRNKLELSWSTRAFSAEPRPAGVEEVRGAYLGFHPPGWFAKVVPVSGCPLGTPAMNALIGRVAALQLAPAWDNHRHEGHFRHLVVRDAGTVEAPQVLATVVTTSAASPEAMEALAQALEGSPGLIGLLWVVNDGVADVASGELRAVLRGRDHLFFQLGPARLQIPHDGFFQVNTEGAALLIGIIEQALGEGGGALLDLYCGVGAIGLSLSHRYDRIVGIELFEPSILVARANAAAMGVESEWHAGPVEKVLPTLAIEGRRSIVVDPPRAGLHPDAARYLATAPGDVLVYVACNPASLGRDRLLLEAGGWRLTDLWGVDLFPQTPRIEAVARFVRPPAAPTEG